MSPTSSVLIFQSNVQQETIDRLYAENPIPPSHWIGPSWVDNKKWQRIMELSQAIEKYHCTTRLLVLPKYLNISLLIA